MYLHMYRMYGNRLPSGMTYEPPTAWNWSGPTDNACSYYPPQADPFGFYSTPQARLPFFPDMGISPYASSTNDVDFNTANGRLTFLGSQSASRCGNGVMGVKDEPQLDNSNDRLVVMCCSTLSFDLSLPWLVDFPKRQLVFVFLSTVLSNRRPYVFSRLCFLLFFLIFHFLSET